MQGWLNGKKIISIPKDAPSTDTLTKIQNPVPFLIKNNGKLKI